MKPSIYQIICAIIITAILFIVSQDTEIPDYPTTVNLSEEYCSKNDCKL